MHCVGFEVASFRLSAEEEQKARRDLSAVRKQLKSLSLEHNIDSALFRLKKKYSLWERLPFYVAWFHARMGVSGESRPAAFTN